MAKKTNVDPRKVLDQDISTFEDGMKHLYKGNWPSARKAFETVAASQVGTTLGERARRYVEVCETRSSTPGDDGDNFLAAVVAKNDGDFETAMDLCTRGGLKGRDERFAYLAAVIEGLRENHEESARLLESAIEMNPENRVHAFHDPDFDELREHPEHEALFSVD